MFKKFISSVAALIAFVTCGCSCVSIQQQVVPELNRKELASAFVFIKVEGTLNTCDVNGQCEKATAGGSGSGFGVAEDLVMTAAHVCQMDLDFKAFGADSKILGFDIDGNPSVMTIVDMDVDSDICLLKGDGLDSMTTVKIAYDDVQMGDHATLIGAPHGFWSPEMILMFDGYVAGTILDPMGRSLDRVVYSIFGLPGVSGGMIVNDGGQVVGIAILARSDIQHTIIAVQLKDIQSFAKRNNL
jgi:S1-C subfamily serine protease